MVYFLKTYAFVTTSEVTEITGNELHFGDPLLCRRQLTLWKQSNRLWAN